MSSSNNKWIRPNSQRLPRNFWQWKIEIDFWSFLLTLSIIRNWGHEGGYKYYQTRSFQNLVLNNNLLIQPTKKSEDFFASMNIFFPIHQKTSCCYETSLGSLTRWGEVLLEWPNKRERSQHCMAKRNFLLQKIDRWTTKRKVPILQNCKYVTNSCWLGSFSHERARFCKYPCVNFSSLLHFWSKSIYYNYRTYWPNIFEHNIFEHINIGSDHVTTVLKTQETIFCCLKKNYYLVFRLRKRH